MRRLLWMAALLCGLLASDQQSLADDPPTDEYFLSMRAMQVETEPRYVTASPVATDEQTEPVAACDGQTYYLTSNDAAAVSAALANANIVQLQTAAAGTQPQDSSIVCVLQAGP